MYVLQQHITEHGLVETDGNILISGFGTKESLYTYLISTGITIPPDNHKLDVSPKYFLAIWNSKFKHVYCEGDEPKCPTCGKLENEIAKLKRTDPLYHKLCAEREQHLSKVHTQYQYSVHLQEQAHSGAYNWWSIYGDYKGALEIPKTIGRNIIFESKALLKVHYSGFLIDNKDIFYYYLHPEHWSEDSNTVISTLHLLLSQQTNLPEEIRLIFDRHGTNQSNLVQAYFEWLVRFEKVFKRIEYNTTVAYHGKSRMDQGNSPITLEYQHSEKFSIAELAEGVNKCGGHKGYSSVALWDWEDFFKGKIRGKLSQIRPKS